MAQNFSTENMLQLCFERENKAGCGRQLTGPCPEPGGAGLRFLGASRPENSAI